METTNVSTNEGIKKMWNEILMFVTKWKELEIITVCEISQPLYDLTYMGNFKSWSQKFRVDEWLSERSRRVGMDEG